MNLHQYVFKGKYKFINGLKVKNQTVHCMFTRFDTLLPKLWFELDLKGFLQIKSSFLNHDILLYHESHDDFKGELISTKSYPLKRSGHSFFFVFKLWSKVSLMKVTFKLKAILYIMTHDIVAWLFKTNLY